MQAIVCTYGPQYHCLNWRCCFYIWRAQQTVSPSTSRGKILNTSLAVEILHLGRFCSWNFTQKFQWQPSFSWKWKFLSNMTRFFYHVLYIISGVSNRRKKNIVIIDLRGWSDNYYILENNYILDNLRTFPMFFILIGEIGYKTVQTTCFA